MNLKIILVLLLFTGVCSAQPADFIASYPFTGNANDVSGNGRHGTVVGATLTADRFGQPNSAYSFPGTTGNYIYLGIHDLFSVSDKLTIAAWIKPRSDYSAVQTIFYTRQTHLIYTKYNDGMQFTVFGPTSSGSSGMGLGKSGLNIPANQWTFVACTYDGEYGTMHINCQTLERFRVPGIDINWPASETYIGSGGITNSYNLMFLGDIDDVKLYNRALSVSEVQALYNGGLPGNQPGEIVAFSLPQQTSAANIDPATRKITVEIPCTQDPTKLAASFDLSPGNSAYIKNVLQQSGVTVNDFTMPVTYTLYKLGACGSADWTVQLVKKPWPDDEVDAKTRITSFTMPQQIKPSLIDTVARIVKVHLPCNADLKRLKPGFTLSEGASAYVKGVLQQTNVSSNDFSSPVIYHITTPHGCGANNWTVQAIREQWDVARIEESTSFQNFTFPQQASQAVINYQEKTITAEVLCSADLKSLSPVFTLSAGASAHVNGTLQVSNETLNDFRNDLVYTVTDAKNCYHTDWTVKLTKPQFSVDSVESDSRRFQIPNVFTPNRDNLNETFEIGEILQGSELTVFNRYGDKVYQTASYHNTFTGSELSAGTYFYALKTGCAERSLKGVLTIIK